MKQKSWILSLLALVLIACAMVQPALAYFTANTEANGAIPLNFHYQTKIEEYVEDFMKSVVIVNTGGDEPENAEPVWVRARAYSGVTYPLIITGGTGWSEDTEDPEEPNWWYFADPVPVQTSEENGKTTPLVVQITGIPEKEAEGHEFANFNVSVVYETARVYYDINGDPLPADWTLVVDKASTSPSGS